MPGIALPVMVKVGCALTKTGLNKVLLWHRKHLFPDWPALSFKDLQPEHLEQVLTIPAEVIIIGRPNVSNFPPLPSGKLVQHGVGFEIMTTDAACRTYNVLLSEARPSVGAFFL